MAIGKEPNSGNNINEFIFLTSKDEFLTNKYIFELRASSFDFNWYQLLLFIYYFLLSIDYGGRIANSRNRTNQNSPACRLLPSWEELHAVINNLAAAIQKGISRRILSWMSCDDGSWSRAAGEDRTEPFVRRPAPTRVDAASRQCHPIQLHFLKPYVGTKVNDQ